MALMNPAVTVEAITVVAGNVPLPAAVNNALMTVERCSAAGGSTAPVFVGLDAPRSRQLETAQFVHGEDGMGDIGLAPATTKPAGHDAVDELINRATSAPGELTLVTLGPLTNVAAALDLDPDLLTRYKHTVMMAGAPDDVGNLNRLGEFNVWCDPEAAERVLAAPGAKTMVGWNISRLHAVMAPHEQAALPALGPLGSFVHQINRVVNEYCLSNGLAGYDLPDPIAMSIAIDPTIATDVSEATVRIHLHGTDERGWSQVVEADPADPALGPPIRVVWEADGARFKQQLENACLAGAP